MVVKKVNYNYFIIHYFGFLSGWGEIKTRTEEEAEKVKNKLEAAGFNCFIDNISGVAEYKED